MKRVVYGLGALLALASLLLYLSALARHGETLGTINWNASTCGWLIAALVLYLATYLLVSVAWWTCLDALGYALPFSTTFRILLTSQFAKYLPGNVGQHIGRVVMARAVGVPTEALVSSLFIDLGLVVLTAALSSLPVLALAVSMIERFEIGIGRTLLIGLVVLGCLFTISLLVARVRNFLRHLVGQIGVLVYRHQRGRLALMFSMHMSSFLVGTVLLWAIAHALRLATPALPELLGVYSLSWLIGFLVPGAPAGLGVRELVLTLSLTPITGIGGATALAALLRLVTTIGDGLAFLFAMTMRRRKSTI